MLETYDVPADGEDEYRHFIIPTNFGQDMSVSAVDVQPGNSRTVHHVTVYLDTSGRARELDAEDSFATEEGVIIDDTVPIEAYAETIPADPSASPESMDKDDAPDSTTGTDS